ncbi:Lrp/AsnC family transcriptional regulator [Aquimarina spongiae]|uniref:Transcriptional regulator, AsnC family n=1 Tax=Aquimarina spongiae TaxID=570521 RepID=A0A1M6HHF1_9FLAO|nr:Lrp/AsnC family transcriptional regulator [Aquimarina spongiae]SHJ21650.1 transcriptional regulator, AsnC family [Aquimarina spongiae]
MADQLDLKIINALIKNSKASYVELGNTIGLSPSSVRERIKKMEDEAIIKKYGITLDYAKLGYGLEVFIMLKLHSGKLDPFTKEWNSLSEIKEIYRVTGNYNIFLKAILVDQIHLQKFIDQLISYGEPTTHLILSDLTNTIDK